MNKLMDLGEKLKNMLFGMDFAATAFVLYVAKMLYFTPSFADAPIFLSICCVLVYDKFLKSKKPDPIRLNGEVQAKIEELQKSLRDTQMEKNISKVKRYF
jgi:hypothetical protein